jgi:hypothetical protein
VSLCGKLGLGEVQQWVSLVSVIYEVTRFLNRLGSRSVFFSLAPLDHFLPPGKLWCCEPLVLVLGLESVF